jgi:argininosuccinate lyase
VIAQGAPLGAGYDAFAAAFTAETGRATSLSPEGFAEAVAPETFVARRDRPGGPAPAALDAALAEYRRDPYGTHTRSIHRRTRQNEAAATLASAFAKLLET